MSLFSRLVLFSDVQGVVLKNGEPVQDAELVQDVAWSDNKSDVSSRLVRTDAQGRFHFSTLEHRAGVTRMLPHQPVILQTITIRHEGVDYTAWRHTRNSYAANAELDGKSLKLECELTREAGFEGTHFGICRVV